MKFSWYGSKAMGTTRFAWAKLGLLAVLLAACGGSTTEVSGNGTPQGLLNGVTSGPTLLSGGEFGPEASLYTVVTGLVLTAVFMWLARRRGHVVPPRRRAGRTGAIATLPR